MAIGAAVGDWGKGAVNDMEDVATIQELLTRAAKALGNPKYDPKGIDGKISGRAKDSNTVKAIKEFQKRWMSHPDGIISPGFKTIIDLVKFAGDLPIFDPLGVIRDAVNAVDKSVKGFGAGMFGPSFPLKVVPPHYEPHNYHRRWFGAKRWKKDKNTKEIIGYRKHAGVDLCKPQGTPVYAVKSGRIVSKLDHFYKESYQLKIDHDDFLVRYCELELKYAPGIAIGEKVAQGQLIGWIGRHHMCHFEMYQNTMTGDLTTGSRYTKKWEDAVFNRRADILNPTAWLKSWEKNLPDGH